MSFYSKLRFALSGKLAEKELNLLPRSYQIIGKILIIKLDKKLLKKRREIAWAIIELLPYVHTVVLLKGIKNIERQPRIEILAGCLRTETLHREHGCSFLLDVSKIMWSKGNKFEKLRLLKQVKNGETIVDMFAGVGYWTIPITRNKKVKIYAIDINPDAIDYLQKNAIINKVADKIEVLQGDCRKFSKLLENTADRIIMGWLDKTERFLPAAVKIAKSGCVIHMHRTVREDQIERMKKTLEKQFKVLAVKKVKSIGPRQLHVVFDLIKR